MNIENLGTLTGGREIFRMLGINFLRGLASSLEAWNLSSLSAVGLSRRRALITRHSKDKQRIIAGIEYALAAEKSKA